MNITLGDEFERRIAKKIKSGLYQTPNFSDSSNQIFIEVDAAVSGLKVERY